MTFHNYQENAIRTSQLSGDLKEDLKNLALGIAGEAGEVIDVIKKFATHHHPENSSIAKLKEELGDLLWYIASIAEAADLELEDIAKFNIDKLKKRYPNGFSVERSINRDE